MLAYTPKLRILPEFIEAQSINKAKLYKMLLIGECKKEKINIKIVKEKPCLSYFSECLLF